MKATIDKAGRLVIPKVLRERLGLRPGPVTVVADGSGLRIEPSTRDDLAESRNRLVVPPTGIEIDDESVQALRDANQR